MDARFLAPFEMVEDAASCYAESQPDVHLCEASDRSDHTSTYERVSGFAAQLAVRDRSQHFRTISKIHDPVISEKGDQANKAAEMGNTFFSHTRPVLIFSPTV